MKLTKEILAPHYGELYFHCSTAKGKKAVKVTAIFAGPEAVDEANAYMAENEGEGVLACLGEGEQVILIADTSDAGFPVDQKPAKKGGKSP